MSEAGANTPANHFGGSFGPNEWLVQEMYERYQVDPTSVDKAWWDFFADFKGTPSLSTSTNSGSPKPGVPPIPKSQIAKKIEYVLAGEIRQSAVQRQSYFNLSDV